jgi:hypothetical protein
MYLCVFKTDANSSDFGIAVESIFVGKVIKKHSVYSTWTTAKNQDFVAI